jgi:signal transduction histidine kinase
LPPEILKRVKQNGAHTGVGLMSMRERLTEVGGCLEISSDQQGTIVEAALPVGRKAGSASLRAL